MRYISAVAIIVLTISMGTASWAIEDYNDRFVKNYPPGFHGMWYKAQRFYERTDPASLDYQEKYRWDRYMSNVLGVHYPFYPIPFGWEYGSTRTFALPDYNLNDWR